jgi:LPS export ABC transporter protein LptC
MSTGPVHAKRIKGLLLTIGVLILACILALFVLRRQTDPPAQPDISSEKRKSTISLSGMFHTEIRNGIKELLIEAENAMLYRDENISKLYGLKATFYNEKGKTVYLTAAAGILMGDIEGESFDLEVSGDVVLKNEQYEMRTETLTYNSEKREFETQSPVVIVVSGITQRADWMTYNLDSGEINSAGNVNSSLKGDF